MQSWPGYALGMILTAALGVFLTWYPLTRTLDYWSYDLPFLWRASMDPEEVLIVFWDAESGRQLAGAPGLPPDRRLQARLLDRLTEGGARAVFFDFIFLADIPEADADLAAALKRNGRTILAAKFVEANQGTGSKPGLELSSLWLPNPALREASVGWGVVNLPADRDQRAPASRRFWANAPDSLWKSAPEVILDALNSTSAQPVGGTDNRWVNFLGPPGHVPSLPYDRALNVGPGEFRGKVVFVGVKPDTGHFENDSFTTPYTRLGGNLMPGVEVLATQFLNLRRHDWLTPVPLVLQTALAAGFGLLLCLGTLSLKPGRAALLSLGASCLVVVVSFWLVWRHHYWWTWLVPAAVQSPFALVWSVGYNYLVVERRGRKLRRAFAAYLSPVMAEQIANSNVELTLGGEEVKGTVMFTDLEGFTRMSETLPPREVSRILTTYFNRTTRAILEQDGTIIKYIGDAVMAVWGAPLPDVRMADHAVLAACGMARRGREEIEGRRLNTRIGIHTGLVLAGNLGSDFRFDYTLIGDTINLASRLEGLNKYLGTEILVSDATFSEVTIPIASRRLGRFLVAGKKIPVVIHEVLADGDPGAVRSEWVTCFEQGLNAFEAGDLTAAEKGFSDATARRTDGDGPSRFYLREIERRRRVELTTEELQGVVVLKDK